MGCAHSRSKIDEDIIEDFEEKLLFSRFTIREMKQAFSHVSGASSVSLAQIQKFLCNLKIKYSSEEKRDVFDKFISHFEIGDDTYDLTDLLAVLYVLSKNPIEEKGLALFDLFDKRSTGCLYKEEAEAAFDCICKAVCKYSEGFLDEDEESKQLHEDISDKIKDSLVAKLVDFFFEGKGQIKYEHFKASLLKASMKSELIDITSPKSIRRVLMEYVFTNHKSKIELMQTYQLRKSKVKYTFKESSENSSANNSRISTRNSIDTPVNTSFK